MGYGLTPIAVDLEDVKSVFGRRDESIIPILKSSFDFRFNELDWDEDAELDLETAIRDLITGVEPNPEYGHLYAYGLELICWHFGEHLSNEHWSAMQGEWADTVEAALQSLGLDQTILGIHNHIFYRGAPLPLPEPDDFPFIGFVLNREIQPALNALNSLRLDALNREVMDAVSEIQGWLQTCQSSDLDLITFYY